MNAPFVTYESSDRVAIVTFNRPDRRNAIATIEDCDDIVAAVARAGADANVSALILTGAPPAFCSGGDLAAIRDRTGIGPRKTPAETRDNYMRGVQRVTATIADVEIPTIAAINGAARGLGLGVALACDLRVCADDANMALNFGALGIVAGDGGAWLAVRAIGYARAAEMLLSSETINAARALDLGLVNKVAPAGALMDEARALAARIAANPRRTLRLNKRLLREACHGRLSDIQQLAAAFQALAHETADHKEAIDAFVEKRPPKFTGD